MSTVENITPVTEEKINLKEVIEKKTVDSENVDNDEPETKKQRLSDLKDDIKDSDGKAQNGDDVEEDQDAKDGDDEVDEKDEEEVETSEKGTEEHVKEKDCNGSSAKVTENGDSAENEVNA